MKPKRRRKQLVKQVISCLMIIAMLAPNTVPLLAYGANWLGNRPRYVDFTRPSALTLNDLRLASGSNFDDLILNEDEMILDEDEIDGIIHVATDSDAELRDPEFFYEDIPEEPDGILVDFSEKSRTYLVEEGVGVDEEGEPIHSYITVIGESPWMYKDSDGFVRYYDNTLMPISSRKEELKVATGADADIATGSNYRRTRSIITTTKYKNTQGDAEIQIPDEMDTQNGFLLSNGEDTLEIIPVEGEFKSSIVLDNVIRYSNVFPDIDFQYTILGNAIKEDIIILGQQERNEFSYKLEGTGLKFKKVGNSVVAYKESYRKPDFRLTAPVMVDAAGEPSIDIKVRFDSSKNIITFVADKDWLDDPDRVYPVRIDPGAELIGYNAFTVNMVAKGDKPEYSESDEYDLSVYNKHFGDTGHTMVGY